MANYTAKLVDHTESPEMAGFRGGISRIAQELFDQAFEGTKDKVVVSWGTGSASDNLVVHFVLDRDHSYIQKKWPAARIDPEAGGHTLTEGALAATEVYQMAHSHRQHVRQLGVLVFHEALHNLLPYWGTDEMHNLDGGGEAAGLAAKVVGPHAKMTARNKELMRRGFSVRNPQWL